jgi:DNA polymerase I-like protein with 3'-5' exonuclease and polymerase domains
MQGVEAATRTLAMGKHAAHAITRQEMSVFKQRGRYLRTEWGPVLPTIHPAYVLRRLGEKAERADPSRDFFDDIEKLGREPYNGPGTSYRVANVSDTLGWIRRIASQGGVVSFDIECDNRPWPGKSRYLVSPFRDAILCASLSWEEGFALVVPGDVLLGFSREWCELFRDPNITWTGHNVKFDSKMLQIWLGDRPRYPGFWDTLLAHYVVDERKGTHALKPKMIARYFDLEDYEPDLIQKHVRAKTVGWGNIPKDDLYRYSALDGDYERRLYFPLKEEVEQEGMESVLDFLLEVTDTMIHLELQGAPISEERLDRVEAAHAKLEAETEAQLQQLVDEHQTLKVLEGGRYAESLKGEEGAKRLILERVFVEKFNVRSVKQVAHYLYDIMGYTPPRGRTIRTKSGRSTNAEALEKLAALHPDNEFFGTLRLYRRHKKFVSAYCANLRMLSQEGPSPDKPAFYPQYMLIGTETGRLSGSIGMTWPSAADLDMPVQERIRTCFVAPPGKVWVKIDYSQAELRLIGWYSGDEFLKQVYMEGRDLHNEVSMKLFGKSRWELESKFSRAVKAVNFRFAYLPKTSTTIFVEGMLLDPARAKQVTEEYEAMFGKAIEWKKKQIRTMEEEQEVVSVVGRKRRFPLIANANRDEYEKSAINAPVQSTSSDLVLASLPVLRRLIEENPHWGAQMVLLLHDEVDLVLFPEQLEEFAAAARPAMEVEVPARFGIYPEDMPLKVDFSVGPSWGEVEDWDG